MGGQTRRQALAAAGAALAAAALPARALSDPARIRPILNDASGLNPTPVFRHWVPRPDSEAMLVESLRRELKEAAAERRPFCVSAARHSMGGQSLARNGTVATLDIDRVELDSASHTYRVFGGTRWHQVIARLDPAGFSPAVMQSNADFGVAATFSVNAHGWPTPYGPFGATVRAIRLMLADGSLVNASRHENPELFSLAMGGYGLAGVILDLDVEMVANGMLRQMVETIPAEAFATRFREHTLDPAVRMIYGRLNVEREALFREAVLVSYRHEPTPRDGLPPATQAPRLGELARRIYRAQTGSEWAKRFRWFMESSAAPLILPDTTTRNSLLTEPVATLRNRHRGRTDILHEYFLPFAGFAAFLEGCRRIIPAGRAEFLNVTLRHVRQDESSLLTFAGTDRIAAVMSFSQRIEPRFEADMVAMTEQLIDLAISLGGSFYLPYRLHARPDQLRRAYPQWQRFAERKRHYDPGLLFRNTMWDTYFG